MTMAQKLASVNAQCTPVVKDTDHLNVLLRLIPLREYNYWGL